MPAHLRPLDTCFQPGCPKPPTKELRNGANGVIGRFCDKHATDALRDYRRLYENVAD